MNYLFFHDSCQTSYFKICLADPHQIFEVGRTVAVDDQSEISFFIPRDVFVQVIAVVKGWLVQMDMTDCSTLPASGTGQHANAGLVAWHHVNESVAQMWNVILYHLL